MTGYYDLITRIKEHFEADPIVNTVTQGDIFRVDLNKQTIFPLVHLLPLYRLQTLFVGFE